MKKLLVVVDMQKDFVTGCLGTKEAREITEKLAEYAETFDGDVVFTRDTHGENYPDTQEGKKLPVVHCIKGSDGWELVPELAKAAEGKKIFDKPCFGSVELAEYVKDNFGKGAAYDEIQLCGVCTGICVISNALLIKAFAPEAVVKVLKDFCACVTPASHENALQAMQTCQIDIV